MPVPTKKERLELRLTTEQKREIERAAAISGTTVTDFSVPVLIESAGAVIRSAREMKMSAQAWDEFNAVLDRPAKTVDGLVDLMKRPSVFEE